MQLCLDFDRSVKKPVINDHDLTKRPVLKLDTPDAEIRRLFGQHFLTGWLKVKHSVRF